MKNKIPFLDVKTQNRSLIKESLPAIKKILLSGDFILGEEVRAFEKEFADYCGAKYAVGVNSGTDALFLALLSLGIGRGDEVICPVYTYIASALSISYTGAVPVFVDIDERTFNIDPDKIEAKITPRTKAIMAVHLYGLAAQMPKIKKIAKKHKLKIIEDAAQAHGAAIRQPNGQWQQVGVFGDVGCFSFYPTKNLGGCGDGGLLTTNSRTIFEKLLMLRDQGRKGSVRYLHYIKGYNSRLDSIQAALLRIKLRVLEQQNDSRRKTAEVYASVLSSAKGVTMPLIPDDCRHVFHVYTLLVPQRDKLCDWLKQNNIGAGIVYHRALHQQQAYRELGHKKGSFPVAEKVSANVLSLPMFAGIPEKTAKYIAKKIVEFTGKK